MKLAVSGDAEAFATVFMSYYDKFLSLTKKILFSKEDAEDAVMAAYKRAYNALNTFDTNCAFFPWCATIVRHTAINMLRRSHRDNDMISLDEDSDVVQKIVDTFPAKIKSIKEAAADEDEKQLLWKAISRLPIDLRELLIMRYYHGQSYREIAEVIGLPVGTVMSRLHAAKQALKFNFIELSY